MLCALRVLVDRDDLARIATQQYGSTYVLFGPVKGSRGCLLSKTDK